MNLHTEEHQVIITSIEEALASLMEQKSFSEITISELVRKSGVARSTFYRNYDTKEDIIRNSIRRTIAEFDQQYHSRTIDERYESEYILQVWDYIIRYSKQLRIISRAGLSGLYLEEFNRHLMQIHGKNISTGEKVRLFGLAGAQYNIIFNLAMKTDQKIDLKKFDFRCTF